MTLNAFAQLFVFLIVLLACAKPLGLYMARVYSGQFPASTGRLGRLERAIYRILRLDTDSLNPRKADLHRWRETFAEKLRGYGVEAEATRRATRGATRRYPELWQLNAGRDGRLLKVPATAVKGAAARASREDAQLAWREIAAALGASGSEADRQLARSIRAFTEDVSRRAAQELVSAPEQNPTPAQAVRAR